MLGGGASRAMSDSLKQNREPLQKERKTFLKKKPVDAKNTGGVADKDHNLTEDEMTKLKERLRAESKRARRRDIAILLVLLVIGVSIAWWLMQ